MAAKHHWKESIASVRKDFEAASSRLNFPIQLRHGLVLSSGKEPILPRPLQWWYWLLEFEGEPSKASIPFNANIANVIPPDKHRSFHPCELYEVRQEKRYEDSLFYGEKAVLNEYITLASNAAQILWDECPGFEIQYKRGGHLGWTGFLYRLAWKLDVSRVVGPLKGWIYWNLPNGYSFSCDEDEEITKKRIDDLRKRGIERYEWFWYAQLERDVFTASIMALDELEKLLSEASSSDDQSVKRRKGNRSSDALILWNTLVAYHGLDTDDKHFEPALQRDLLSPALLGKMRWDTARLSRAFKKLFPNGMKDYKAACANETVKGFVTKLEDGDVQADAFDWMKYHPTDQEERRSNSF